MESTETPASDDVRPSFFSTDATHVDHARQFKYFEPNDAFSDNNSLRCSKNSSLLRALNDFMKSSCSYVERLVSHGIGKSRLLTFLLNALQKKEPLTAACNSDTRTVPFAAMDRDTQLAFLIREELNDLQGCGFKLFEAVQELTQRLNNACSTSQFNAVNSTVSHEGDALTKLLPPSALPENAKKRQAFDEQEMCDDRLQSCSPAPNRRSSPRLEQGQKKLRIGPLSSYRITALPDQIEKSPSLTNKGLSGTKDWIVVASDNDGCLHPRDNDVNTELEKTIECRSSAQNQNHDKLADSIYSQPSWAIQKSEWSSQSDDDFKSDSSHSTSDIDQDIYHEAENLYLYNNEDEESEMTENFVGGKDQTGLNDSSSDEEVLDTASTNLFLADPSDNTSIRIILPTCVRLSNNSDDENCNQDLSSNMRKRGFDESADSPPESGSTKRFFI